MTARQTSCLMASRVTGVLTLLVRGLLLNLLVPTLAAGQGPAAGAAASVYRENSPAVFLLEVRDERGEPTGIGSAFLIEGNRLVTNAHVVRGGTVVLRTGVVALPLTIERVSETHDLAVLRSSTPLEVTPLRLAGGEPEIGTAIYVLGNPRGLERTISEGLISGMRERGAVRLLQVTAPISPGSSGGPVVNAAGEVVGVTVGYLDGGQNLNFAVPVTTLRTVLAEPTVVAGASAGSSAGSARRFAEHIASVRQRLATPPAPHDTAEWNARRLLLRATLIGAGDEATTAAEFLELAALADRAGEWDLAEDAARAAVAVDPAVADSARALLIEQWTLDVFLPGVSTSEREARLAVADTQVARRPRDANAHRFRADVLALLGRGPEALSAARRAAALVRPSETNGSLIWSTFHRVAAAYGSAALDDSVFQAMTRARAASAWIQLDHAEHLERREAWASSTALYRAALPLLDEPWPKASCSLGRVAWLADQVDEALAALRACLEQYQVAIYVDTADVATAHRLIAAVLNERHVFPQAAVHAQQSLATMPEHNPWAAYQLSRAYLGLERYREAAAAAEEAVRMSDGRLSDMHFVAGDAYFEMQDWSRCARAYTKAAELEPTKTAAPYNAALCLARQGFRLDAARMMETVLQRDPNHPNRADIRRMITRWRS